MSIKSLKVFAGLVALSFLIFGVIILVSTSFRPNINIEKIKVSGSTYSLKNGIFFKEGRELNVFYDSFLYFRYKNLLNFYQVTLEDPIFASHNINESELEKSINLIDKHQSSFLEKFNVEEEIVSTEFLRAVIQVSKSQEAFMGNVSLESANNLIKNQEEAQGVYLESISRLQKSLQLLGGEEKKYSFVNISSRTTDEIIASDLELMKKNGEALRAEINERKKILTGDTDYTRSPKNILADFYVEKTLPSNLIPRERLPESLGVFDNNLYLVKTGCFGNFDSKTPFYISILNSQDAGPIIRFKSAQENYYAKLSENIPIEKELIEKGLNWRIIQEGNTYRCNELEYQADLLMMYEFFTQNKEPILHKLNIDQKEEHRLFEKEVFQSSVKNIEHLELLSKIYFNAYLKEVDSVLYKNKNQSYINELLERHLFIKNRMSSLEKIFNTNLHFLNLTRRAEKGLILYDPRMFDHFSVTRSSYSLVFLNFSGSVWRIPEGPTYLSRELVPNIMSSNLSELRKKYTEEQIKRFEEISESDVIGDR